MFHWEHDHSKNTVELDLKTEECLTFGSVFVCHQERASSNRFQRWLVTELQRAEEQQHHSTNHQHHSFLLCRSCDQREEKNKPYGSDLPVSTLHHLHWLQWRVLNTSNSHMCGCLFTTTTFNEPCCWCCANVLLANRAHHLHIDTDRGH